MTGGSDGLGRAVAARARSEGATVTIVARDPKRLEAARAQIDPAGGSELTIPCDVTVDGALDDAVESAVQNWGRVDGSRRRQERTRAEASRP